MKTIALIPVKNEDWILESALRNLTPQVDFVLVADQKSTDRTLEICAKFENVKVIQNPYEGHSNKVRWLLLDEARKLGEGSLLICVDADEMIAPAGIQRMKDMAASGQAKKGDIFRLRWVQLWKDTGHFRNDGAWKDSFKNIAFIDNAGVNEYRKDFVINDHTTRVPDTSPGNIIEIEYPLLHFLFLASRRNQEKQAWYRCTELMQGARNAKRINNTYRVTLNPEDAESHKIDPSWVKDLDLQQHLDQVSSNWHLQAILGFFDTRGIEFFEELQIWHVLELHDEFVRRVGREPVSRTYPAWLSSLNEIKNHIRNFRFK